MTDKNYIKLILGHIAIGFCVFFFPVLPKLYAFLIVIIGLYFIIKNKNRKNEVLYASAYITGCEVFLRATEGDPFHEYGRYFILLFIGFGFFYKGIPRKWNPYFIFLVLLIPGIFLTVESINDDIRKKIFFDILGPVTLGITALYTYKRKITTSEMNQLLLCIGLPIISYCTLLLLKYPLRNTIIDNTESNAFLSGNFGPNQVATALGLGMFVFFFRLFSASPSYKLFFINLAIFSCIYYRGLLTFSRGGMITGVIMIALLLVYAAIHYKKYASDKLKFGLPFFLIPLVFILASFQTDNLLFKRYNNQNPSGLYKSPETYGREDIAKEEIKLFEENPVMGIGVGKTKEIRKSKLNTSISSHNEITRMLAEHGIFGVLSLLILILTPFVLFLKNKQNIYLICFFVFWLLTINHSGMRVAATSFVYALALFSIERDSEVNLV